MKTIRSLHREKVRRLGEKGDTCRETRRRGASKGVPIGPVGSLSLLVLSVLSGVDHKWRRGRKVVRKGLEKSRGGGVAGGEATPLDARVRF